MRNDDSDFEDVFDDTTDFHHNSSEERALKQAGYREGKVKAEEKYLQEGFNDGYLNGMKVGQLLGSFLAKLAVYQKEVSRISVGDSSNSNGSVVDELIKSLLFEGSKRKYSDEYLREIESRIIAHLPELVKTQFDDFRISLDARAGYEEI
jgi:hypothetical protein